MQFPQLAVRFVEVGYLGHAIEVSSLAALVKCEASTELLCVREFA